ncbi:MAG: hypothetical protein K2I63_05030, partial [Helicobacter sp.]|nr:hypothetical protein [Helicobacter sp.]
ILICRLKLILKKNSKIIALLFKAILKGEKKYPKNALLQEFTSQDFKKSNSTRPSPNEILKTSLENPNTEQDSIKHQNEQSHTKDPIPQTAKSSSNNKNLLHSNNPQAPLNIEG